MSNKMTQSVEEWINSTDCNVDSYMNPYDAARLGYEAGAASRQAEIGEIIQNLIKRADEKASELHIRDTEYAYFQGMAEGLNTLLHSIGLDDDFDKILKGKEND